MEASSVAGAVLTVFAVSVSSALALNVRASSAIHAEALIQQGPDSDAGGLPAWLIAVIAASSALVCALVAVIIYFVAKRTIKRRREAVQANQAAPELFDQTDSEAPTPRGREGVWVSTDKTIEQKDSLPPQGAY